MRIVLLGPTENLHRHIDSDVKMKSIKPGKAIIVAQSTEGQKHKHLIKTKKKTTRLGGFVFGKLHRKRYWLVYFFILMLISPVEVVISHFPPVAVLGTSALPVSV